jgi:pimeloyl-ACP methyl ester carboxylesterase
MESIELPAGTVHYRAYGPEGGRPVVFVHGFLIDTSLWADVPQRLAEAGFRTYAPTWPLGSHTTAMTAGADLSPRGIARIVIGFLEALDLTDVVLVGSDTGGAVSQLVLSEDPSRVGCLVLTNCDAFDTFPPFPFDVLFKVCRHPAPARAALQSMRSTFLRHSILGFGGLVVRDPEPAESRAWVEPYLSDAGVRRDVAAFCRGWTGKELSDSTGWLSTFEKPVLICWAPDDPYFKLRLGERLAATFPQATLVPFPEARTFVSLDQPEKLANEILAWLGAAG